ncbi:MAG: PD-(D/E)XK nuclease family protein [Planctomycetota bacterium]
MQGVEEVNRNSLQALMDRGLCGISARPDVHVLRASDLPPVEGTAAASAAAAQPGDVLVITPTVSPLPEPHVTATSVGALLSCPRKFYYAALLQVAEGPVISIPRARSGDQPGLTPFVRGRLVHRMLQHLVGRTTSARSVTSLARRFSQDEGLEDEAVVNWVSATATRAAHDFARSEAGIQLGKARGVFRERSFELWLGRARVSGQIDLLIHTRGGRFVIVDYKTDEGVSSEAEAARITASMGYREQILLYALAVQMLLKPSAIESYLFFTHLGRTIPAADCSPLMLGAFRARLSGLLAHAHEADVDRAYPVTTNDAACLSCGFKARKICSKWAAARGPAA